MKNVSRAFFERGIFPDEVEIVIKKWCFGVLLGFFVCGMTGCGGKKEQILIYTSAEDYRIEYLNQRLREEFPQYDIIVDYMSTGNHAARLLAEGTDTLCDITYDLEYGYLEQLEKEGILADLSQRYDMSIYEEDTVLGDCYIVENRNGGAIIVNTEVLEKRGLEMPESYEDLLDPQYKNLISMPNPKASGTGYMFLKSLVNCWGEEAAFSYFDQLTDNILQYTSSGSGPVNALVQEEAAIGLGMTGQAVMQINEGAPLTILYFEEGSPYSLYGQGMIKGKEERTCVKEVFDFLIHTYNYENNEKFLPEKIYRDKEYVIENYPTGIIYSDMSGNSGEEKARLLSEWKY